MCTVMPVGVLGRLKTYALPAAPNATVGHAPSDWLRVSKSRRAAPAAAVIAHGGDPSGVNVSTGALASAFAAAVALARSSAALPAAAGSGGVLVDLGGGSYRVDAPLLLRGASGIRVAGGTLFSDASFPVAGCLLDAQGVSNLVFEDLTLDAARRGHPVHRVSGGPGGGGWLILR